MRDKVQIDADQAQQTLDKLREPKRVSATQQLQDSRALDSGDKQGSVMGNGGNALKNEGQASTKQRNGGGGGRNLMDSDLD